MMIYSNSVKLQESIVHRAVHDLLVHIPDVEISRVGYEQEIEREYRIDGWIDLRRSGINYALIIEMKENGAPRFVRSAIYQLKSFMADFIQFRHADDSRRLIPMLVSPYLSPESRAICTDHDVAYLDLFGNAHLAFDSVYIDRAVAGKPKSETRALQSIFTPKSGAVLRIMLRDRGPRMACRRPRRKKPM